jgi:cytochrome c peroxidase
MGMFRIRCPLLLLLVCLVPSAWAQAGPTPVFTGEEIQQILTLGPWPPAPRPDPSNRVSGQIKAIELGRRLFRDPRMSPTGYIACVSCHQPDRSFTDQKARAHGLADLPRNTPALANLGQQRWFGWAGSSDSLWMASIRPILDAREFDGNPASVVRLFERDPELAACYRSVFNASPERDRQRTLVNVGKALAAYLETLVTGRTGFDDFRDAIARKDPLAAASYPLPAQRGLKLFIGQARCIACHGGPNFSDGAFHAGSARAGALFPIQAGQTGDAGRIEAARSLKTHRLSLLGPYNDAPGRAKAAATRELAAHERMRGQFRTPSLRNVAVTAPYMHDGHVDSLPEALQHLRQATPNQRGSPAEPLSPRQLDDLMAFLLTLTDQHGARRPWTSQEVTPCR